MKGQMNDFCQHVGHVLPSPITTSLEEVSNSTPCPPREGLPILSSVVWSNMALLIFTCVLLPEQDGVTFLVSEISYIWTTD